MPDGVGEIIFYAGAVVAAAHLIYGARRVEREFKVAYRTARNKIQVVLALTLMSRMGISTVLASVGGMDGGVIRGIVPVVGNVIGGVVGTVAGAGMDMYLNRHLQPYRLGLALDINHWR